MKEWKFTESEKLILKNVNDDYNYIARDADNNLFIYEKKPEKLNRECIIYRPIWVGNNCDFVMFNDIFKCVKWNDEEACEFRKYI